MKHNYTIYNGLADMPKGWKKLKFRYYSWRLRRMIRKNGKYLLYGVTGKPNWLFHQRNILGNLWEDK